MIKYFCDICGKELEKWNIFTVTVTPPEIRSFEYFDDTYLLCGSCRKTFQDWLKLVKKEVAQ